MSHQSEFFVDIHPWRQCIDPDIPVRADDALNLDGLRGRRCIASLGWAGEMRITALELLFLPQAPNATAADPYISIGYSFLPFETLLRVPAYQAWDVQDLLKVTDGDIVDYNAILETLRSVRTKCQLEQVAYPPYGLTYFAKILQDEGFSVIQFPQSVRDFNEPMKQLDALISAQTIRHGGSAVMAWQMSNVHIAVTAEGTVFPCKPDAKSEIANPVALIAALGAQTTTGAQT